MLGGEKGINISPSAVVKEAGGVSGEIIRSARELVLTTSKIPPIVDYHDERPVAPQILLNKSVPVGAIAPGRGHWSGAFPAAEPIYG